MDINLVIEESHNICRLSGNEVAAPMLDEKSVETFVGR